MTEDNLKLMAWYAPPENGAVIILILALELRGQFEPVRMGRHIGAASTDPQVQVIVSDGTSFRSVEECTDLSYGSLLRGNADQRRPRLNSRANVPGLV
ncbi:MAG: hypothetical protein KJ064_21160 [Anaerolineae bacterium]|nr:hypothetical protein [Anaerolineae bacterium]